MTVALRAHRLLCRLGLHIAGRWRARPGKAGEYERCPSCRRDRWRPTPVTQESKAAEFLRRLAESDQQDSTEQPKGYPVDRWNFPFTNAQPRDGITHE